MTDTTERFTQTLDAWRARIDELAVQVDLASLDVRDDLRRRLEVTENVYLATRSRLSDARQDAKTNVAGILRGVEQLLHDLRRAYNDAEAVIDRSHDA